MTDIDWSKAPEGATHKHPFGWYKRVDGNWFFVPNGAEDWKPSIHQWTDNEFLAVRPTEQLKWNGEGLPPIGTEVEYLTLELKAEGFTQYLKGKILAYHEGHVWMLEYHDGLPCSFEIRDLEFRPIKSERQIQIDKIESIIYYAECTTTSAAERLYDAGARVTL